MRLGFITGRGLVLGTLAPIFVVIAAIMTGGAIFSAGPLNSVQAPTPIGGAFSHADLGCSDCHAPFWGATLMGDRCLSCHTDVDEELADPVSLHGALADPGNCRTCHSEHNGEQAALTNYDAELYPHAEFGFYLIAHLSAADGTAFACVDCHTESLITFDVGRCGTCHLELDQEFTETHLVDFDTGCLNCHDGIDSYGSEFDHQTTDYPLSGEHLALSCVGCHEGAKNLTQLQQAPQDCIGCHLEDDLHAARLGDDCAACHSTDGWEVAEFDHTLTGFPLVEKHAALDCVDCHLDKPWNEVPLDCIGCHAEEDVHQGRLGTDCVACHNASDWSQILSEDFDHNLTRYRLTGKHASIATCESCHVGGQLAGTPTRCVACHRQDDKHQGSFGLECASCHNTSRWADATFDHDSTGFKLNGAHARVETCVECHSAGQFAGTSSTCISCHRSDDAHNANFGTNCSSCHSTNAWKPANFNHSGQANCASCHTNLKPANHPSGQCSQCHSTTAWKPANFTHTGLTDCASCHTNVRPANHPSGQCSQCHSTSAWKPANFDHTGQPTCQSCHSSDAPNNHYAGDCSTCHGSTSSWANNISFSHAGQTNCRSCHTSDAPNNHYAGQCSACHGSTTNWANNISFSHAGQTNCQSCHTSDAPSNHYAGQCSACHGSTSNWANNISFSHAGQTNCQSCHTSDAPSNHYAGQCSACHGSTSNWANNISFSHAGQTNCQSCHTSDAPSNHYAGQCSACHGSTSNWANNISFSHAGQSNCQSCHSGDKPSTHYSGQCSACHGTSVWRPALNYNHSSGNFPSGHRSNVTCNNCHNNNTEVVSWSSPTYSPSCAGCHANDWRSGPHNGATVSELRNCGGACHQSNPEHRASNGEW